MNKQLPNNPLLWSVLMSDGRTLREHTQAAGYLSVPSVAPQKVTVEEFEMTMRKVNGERVPT